MSTKEEGNVVDINDSLLTRETKLAISLVENGRQNVGEQMKAVGYPESTARKPSSVLSRTSFQAVLAKMLPDNLVVSRHAQLIATDNEAVALGATKLAYQVKGQLTPENTGIANITVNFGNPPKDFESLDGVVVDISEKYSD